MDRRHRHRASAALALAGTCLATACVAPAAAAPSASGTAAGRARAAAGHCHRVRTHGRTARRIRTNIGCDHARRKLHRWLRHRRLPHDQFGWYCAGARHVTCGGGNGGHAPFIRFVRGRARHRHGDRRDNHRRRG